MAHNIAYVVLSDLHLGADSSLLTQLGPDGLSPAPSEVLLDLVECLRELSMAAHRRPVLILLGDILEFALAPDAVASMAFQQFMELVMAPGSELFSDVWYVPGNHDHHLWEGAREAQYAAYISRRPPGQPLERPWHATRMLLKADPEPVASPWLSALLARARGVQDSSITTVYPNLALHHGERCVVLHHGHFIERAYTLLTMLNTAAFGVEAPAHVGDLEADNFAWIDFMWSALGRSGAAGASVHHAYDQLRDPADREALIDRVSAGISVAWENKWPVPLVEDAMQKLIVKTALSELAELADTMGRRAYYGGHADPSQAHTDGVLRYVETYVCEQIGREIPSEPTQLTFIFGHTHHPMSGRLASSALEEDLRVYNTGGWVHETDTREPKVGASIVVLGDGLETASILVYLESADMAHTPVSVVSVDPSDKGFADHVANVVHNGDKGAWSRLVASVDRALPNGRPATA